MLAGMGIDVVLVYVGARRPGSGTKRSDERQRTGIRKDSNNPWQKVTWVKDKNG